MDFTPRLQKCLLAGVAAVLATTWLIAWLAPGIGLHHDDAIYLVTARAMLAGHGYTIDSLPTPIPQARYPPLMSAMLAAFSLISDNVQWLKLGPLACGVAWLWLTWKLLLKMGATQSAAWTVIGLTAAAPMTVFLASNLMPETLFSLLLTAALLLLLEERTIAGGICAGLAFLAQMEGASLIAACVLILLLRKRLRGAAQFTATAASIALPWLGWTTVYSAQDRYYGGVSSVAQNVITDLHASEKVTVIGNNFLSLLASPIALLTDIGNIWTILGTLLLVGWCLYKRRQLVPDLFLFLYFLTLDLWVSPPQRMVLPVLPLILWVIWRGVRTIKKREMVVAGVLILSAATLFATLRELPVTIRNGEFPSSTQPPDDWRQMEKMFAWVRNNTAKDAVVMANLAPLWYLNTGRRAIRGFTPNPFRTYYSAGSTPITPAELSAELLRTQAAYVALSPDRDFAEATAYGKAVEALERGGLLEPVDGIGLARGYRLLKATGASSLR